MRWRMVVRRGETPPRVEYRSVGRGEGRRRDVWLDVAGSLWNDWLGCDLEGVFLSFFFFLDGVAPADDDDDLGAGVHEA